MREGEHLSAVQTRLLPMGMMELVINLHEDSIPLFDRQSRVQRGSTNGTMLCGAHSENFIAQVDRKISVMNIHFRPGGGTAFFGLPAGELHNKNISLDELWQGHAAELRDRLLKTSMKNRFSVLEQFLMQMLRYAFAQRVPLGLSVKPLAYRLLPILLSILPCNSFSECRYQP